MFELKFRVDYADTDAMGVLHHASYLRYLERARTEWLRQQGMPYSEMERQGYYLPLNKALLEYKTPLFFDDEASIMLSVKDVGRAHVVIDYQILKGDVLIAFGETVHVLCKKNSEGKLNPVRIPEEWKGKKEWQMQNV